MDVPNSVLKYGLIALLVVLIGAVIFAAVKKTSYDSQLAALRNQVATSSSTVEVDKGVFEKLSLESEDLKSTLDSKNQQVQELLTQVQKNKEDLLAANQLVVKWKQAYEGAANAKETVVPADPQKPGTLERKRVDFNKDFGMIGVSGYTLTDPAEAEVKVEQLKPLGVTLALSQDAAKAWHSYVTSDDPNTTVQINVSAVNPYVLEPKWYEKIEFNATLAGGEAGTGFGLLAGLGISYKIKQFTVGPAVFVGVSDRLDKYVGVNVGWRPFEQ